MIHALVSLQLVDYAANSYSALRECDVSLKLKRKYSKAHAGGFQHLIWKT